MQHTVNTNKTCVNNALIKNQSLDSSSKDAYVQIKHTYIQVYDTVRHDIQFIRNVH